MTDLLRSENGPPSMSGESTAESRRPLAVPARAQLPPPDVALPIHGPRPAPPSRMVLAGLAEVSSATASSILFHAGIARSSITGPTALTKGKRVVGAAHTLQFMPRREDIVATIAEAAGLPQEFAESRSALWGALEASDTGDVLVVSANGDPHTGCLGEMLLFYLQAQGGIGAVVDGSIRDTPRLGNLELGLWASGVTPNFASQGALYPWAYEVPIACGGVLVLPGDIIIADDDGAVAIPARLAKFVAEHAQHHEEWEEFSRARIAAGGSLTRYYPLVDEDAWQEYETWRAQQESAGDRAGRGGVHPGAGT